MTKTYVKPMFKLVKQDESNKVFFAASGTPGPDPKSAGATLSGIGNW